MKRAVIEGTSLWKANNRTECFQVNRDARALLMTCSHMLGSLWQLYLKTANNASSRLPDDEQRKAVEVRCEPSRFGINLHCSNFSE